METNVSSGVVYLIGGGPGAWDLVTIRGLEALKRADVILTDHLGPVGHLEQLCDVRGKEVVDVSKLPYSKQTSQERINELLISYARESKIVARLKGGDPYVFGRGFEELQAVRAAGIDCHVIPGVTSAVSVPALAAEVPVTHRGITHAFTVVSGHLPPGHKQSLVDWAALAQSGATLSVIMGVKNVAAICQALMDGGMDPETPAVVSQEGSLEQQRSFRASVSTLAQVMEKESVVSPAVYVIGSVAALAIPPQE